MALTQLHSLHDFIDASVAPMPAAHLRSTPRTEPFDVLLSVEDVRCAALRAAASARRLLSIYSADLEPDVYDQPDFLEAVKRFVLSRSFAKVRVLVHRPLGVVGNSNRFVAMARRLTTCIEIRVAAPEFRDRGSAMLIADDHSVVYRKRASSWDGMAGFQQPLVAGLHLKEFDEIWMGSATGQAPRILHG
ncbi:MAG: hypothetical protein RLZZ393_27 [Pseudomonadota bacterium]|jgi:hypothetical protein